MRKAAGFIAAVLMFSGCSLALLGRNCAEGPRESVVSLFNALQSKETISSDLGRAPMSFLDIFNIKAIMRVVTDPRRLLSSLGGGDPKKGWEELKFLWSLVLFHNSSGLEFQEYVMSVEDIQPLGPASEFTNRYRAVLKRTDILLDMRDDDNFREVRKFYRRTFFVEFTSGYCIAAITPAGSWEESDGRR